MRVTTRVVLAIIGLVCAMLPGFAGSNMIGRQSQNEGISVLPAPDKVTIDGDLKEWDWSGRIWIFADSGIRTRYSVEVGAMWDKANLYLAAKWKDPTPMYSTVDPEFNPGDGWKSDAWQMRLLTDHTSWYTTWYYTPKQMPVLHMAHWKDESGDKNGVDITILTAANGTTLGQGAEMAYREDADKAGFVQEIKIPWTLLYRAMPDVKPGLTFRLGNEFLWGDPTGKTWPVHRYADNMQVGKTSREFYWTARDTWGNATLLGKGNVPVRQYIDEGTQIKGTIPVRVTIPANAARFTIVIEDQQGKRVRNLAADCDPNDYTVNTKGNTRTIQVLWDGQDEKGKLVAPGSYRVRGLSHRGLDAEYEMSVYNPGTPPWDTRDGSGSWGSDHTGPNNVAAAGDWMVITCPVVEGGNGVFMLNETGRKCWGGEKRGVSKVAADKDYIYAYVTAWSVPEVLCRLSVKDGSYKPFMLNGKARPFDLPLTDIFNTPTPGKITGIAVQGDRLAVALSSGKIAILDANSAAVRAQYDAPNPGALAFTSTGTLYAVIDGQVCQVNLDNGQYTALPLRGVQTPVALATDLQGNILVGDAGKDSQIKAFTAAGKQVYTCGKQGGRPIRGAFDAQAISHLSSVSVDSKGQVWAVENWNYPRRVSVWGKDGKLIRDYIGNTGYAGASCYLHDQDPTLAYCGPIEMKLDKAAGTWKVTRILWVPDKTKGESFEINTGSNIIPQRFTAKVNGVAHEYLFAHDNGWDTGTGNVVFLEKNGQFQPVAAICLVGHISGNVGHDGVVTEDPSGELAGFSAYDGCIWNDNNGDGKVQRGECVIIPAAKAAHVGQNGAPPLALANGWGGRLGDDFTIYTDGIVRYRPIGFTADGAPRYGLQGFEKLPLNENGDLVPLPSEHELLCLSFKGYAGPTTGMLGVDDRTGDIRWSYANPYPGVHGSHNATMPKPGLLIGPLKITGVADVSPSIGKVFQLRGNLGQDFFFTSDGLYVGTLFQDGRLPGESLPDDESRLKGMPMAGFSEGGEPFNGWFGKQTDGVVRMTNGFARQAGMILTVKGLESIQRFNGMALKVSPTQLAKAQADNLARVSAKGTEKVYQITKLAATPKLDGDAADWGNVPSLAIEREGQPDKATAKLAYDDTNLYVSFDVSDSSPWKNQGKEFTTLFKSGDAVDLQLNVDPNAKDHGNPIAGDERLLFAQLNGKPVVVRMVPVDPTAPTTMQYKLTSPVGTKVFNRIEIMTDANIMVLVSGGRYRVEASIPLKTIGLVPQAGMALRGDIGFISSDVQGMIDTARTYWADPNTNLVNDMPAEAWLYPNTWGSFTF